MPKATEVTSGGVELKRAITPYLILAACLSLVTILTLAYYVEFSPGDVVVILFLTWITGAPLLLLGLRGRIIWDGEVLVHRSAGSPDTEIRSEEITGVIARRLHPRPPKGALPDLIVLGGRHRNRIPAIELSADDYDEEEIRHIVRDIGHLRPDLNIPHNWI